MNTMNTSTLIIAEAGVNHCGRLDLAIKLIDAAARAGADVVKFQTFNSERIVTRFAQKAPYQRAISGGSVCSETQFQMLKDLELSDETHRQLIEHAKVVGIEFLSTGFDIQSLDYLCTLGIRRIKIPSGEITNLPYLRHVSQLGLPVILSTGMAAMEEVRDAFTILTAGGLAKQSITVLHCCSEYPAPFDEINLRAMKTIRDEFGVEVGYSDHTRGIEVPVAAVTLGASVIEKHLTLDVSMSGPDHSASTEPEEFKQMVCAIRNIERAMGSGIKEPSPSELRNLKIIRKSLVAATDIEIGDLFSKSNVTTKRPGTGISPMLWDSVIGKRASRAFRKDDLIEL